MSVQGLKFNCKPIDLACKQAERHAESCSDVTGSTQRFAQSMVAYIPRMVAVGGGAPTTECKQAAVFMSHQPINMAGYDFALSSQSD